MHSSLCSAGSDSKIVCRNMESNPMGRYAMSSACFMLVALLVCATMPRHLGTISQPYLQQNYSIIFHIVIYC